MPHHVLRDGVGTGVVLEDGEDEVDEVIDLEDAILLVEVGEDDVNED